MSNRLLSNMLFAQTQVIYKHKIENQHVLRIRNHAIHILCVYFGMCKIESNFRSLLLFISNLESYIYMYYIYYIYILSTFIRRIKVQLDQMCVIFFLIHCMLKDKEEVHRKIKVKFVDIW